MYYIIINVVPKVFLPPVVTIFRAVFFEDQSSWTKNV